MAVFVGLCVVAMAWATWTGETEKLGPEATLMVAVIVAAGLQKRPKDEDEEPRS